MSKIEWTEKTWNPIIGCSKVSAGCKNCYAERMAYRLGCMGQEAYQRVIHNPEIYLVHKQGTWVGHTYFVDSALDIPLKRKKATTYFVCSMGDLFHESIPFEWILRVYKVFGLCLQHTFQILTKRPERMFEFTQWLAGQDDISIAEWPRNVWLGTTAENQEMADKRIPELLKCPAAKRFLSIEPMLSEIDLDYCVGEHMHWLDYIDWVICGGESGPGARPMHPDWARSIREQCKAAGVPFFFKQWGEWLPLGQGGSAAGSWMDNSHRSKEGEPMYKVTDGYDNLIGTGISHHFDNLGQTTYRIGKKKAGCLLDGAEHKEYPK